MRLLESRLIILPKLYESSGPFPSLATLFDYRSKALVNHASKKAGRRDQDTYGKVLRHSLWVDDHQRP